MSILTGPEIRRLVEWTRNRRAGVGALESPSLDITPFDERLCGPNSYDVHLGTELLRYDIGGVTGVPYLDTRRPNPTVAVPFPADGFIVRPGEFYLAAIAERIECHGLIPWIDGRSSVGRLSLSVHQTAGRGDDGYAGNLTLEISAIVPTKIYPGDRIAQLTFFTTTGERKPYSGRYKGDTKPTASRMHQPNGVA